jgi:aspartate carbamoyltransferase regulatory subunit
LVSPVPGSATKISGLGVVEVREEALSILKIVSLETFSAETSGVVSLALVGDGHADLVSIEGPVLGAGEADLVVPVPGGASRVSGLGVVEVREEALSILKIVSLETFSAETSGVVSLALVGDGHADLVSIEGPVLGAGEADLVVPVPGGASRVSGLGVVEVREEALSILKIVSLETFSAETSGVVSLALVGDGHADLVSIEGPVLGAGEADLVVPVPGGASRVSGLGVVEVREDTLSFSKIVSLETLSAETSGVVSLALVGNGHADLVSIEGPVLGAGEADLVVPVPGGASRVSGLGVVEVREETLSFNQIVSLETLSAESSCVVSLALVGDGHADLVRIKDPVLGTDKTNLVRPVPGSATKISGLGVVEVREEALSILKIVS